MYRYFVYRHNIKTKHVDTKETHPYNIIHINYWVYTNENITG